MLGAIIGDIVGSRFEFNNLKSKEFELFTNECKFTDDTVMTLAVAKGLVEFYEQPLNLLGERQVPMDFYVFKNMQEMGKKYPNRGYGVMFKQWLHSKMPMPYNSFGNGSAMRISPVGELYSAEYLNNVGLNVAKRVSTITHNHEEGIKGAQAVASAIMSASKRNREPMAIKNMIRHEFYPQMDESFTLDNIRKDYQFDETCQGSVPQAIECFCESTSFEDAIRNAISIGGDSDTIACIAGAIAEAYYGVPSKLKFLALRYLDASMKKIIRDFENLKLNKEVKICQI